MLALLMIPVLTVVLTLRLIERLRPKGARCGYCEFEGDPGCMCSFCHIRVCESCARSLRARGIRYWVGACDCAGAA